MFQHMCNNWNLRCSRCSILSCEYFSTLLQSQLRIETKTTQHWVDHDKEGNGHKQTLDLNQDQSSALHQSYGLKPPLSQVSQSRRKNRNNDFVQNVFLQDINVSKAGVASVLQTLINGCKGI